MDRERAKPKKFYRQFRAYITVNGVGKQLYFETEKEAQDCIDKQSKINAIARPPWAQNSKKRAGAKSSDLPVGFFYSKSVRHSKTGAVFHELTVVCVFKVNGKNKTIRRSYGKRRTKDEAIKLLEKAVLKALRETTTTNKKGQ